MERRGVCEPTDGRPDFATSYPGHISFAAAGLEDHRNTGSSPPREGEVHERGARDLRELRLGERDAGCSRNRVADAVLADAIRESPQSGSFGRTLR
jgi:hypothetical protein